MIRPSPVNRATKVPSTVTDSSMTRERLPRVITTSFSARYSATHRPPRSTRAPRISRRSMSAVPAIAGFEQREQLGEVDLGEESQVAEVHAEDRQVAPGLADARGHRQQRAVAAQHEQQVDQSRQVVAAGGAAAGQRGRERRRVGFEHDLDAAGIEPRRHLDEVRRHRRQPNLRDDPDSLDHGPPLRSGSHGAARRCSRNSWLPSAPGHRRRRHRRPSPGRRRPAASVTRAITRSCTSGSRTMPLLAHLVAPRLELRLHQRDHVGARRAAPPAPAAGCARAR